MRADHYVFSGRAGRGDYECVKVRTGRHSVERVIPPAGEAHAFDMHVWGDVIEVTVSPSGRSVQVWWNGVKIERPVGDGR